MSQVKCLRQALSVADNLWPCTNPPPYEQEADAIDGRNLAVEPGDLVRAAAFESAMMASAKVGGIQAVATL